MYNSESQPPIVGITAIDITITLYDPLELDLGATWHWRPSAILKFTHRARL